MRRASIALIAAAVPVAVVAAGATASGADPRASRHVIAPVENPCTGPDARLYLCPDLRMKAPYDLRIDRRQIRGRVLLRATNSIDSRGRGPASLRGRRDGAKTMDARQVLHRRDGRKVYVRTGARLYFMPIPGQGRYWKWADAARFELWKVDKKNRLIRRVRVGPKQVYCLRDLTLTRRKRGWPTRRIYPGCNQSRRTRAVTLGTSPGWSDIYPQSYHQNWIDVTGLRGRHAFVHIADPKNGIWESNEENNAATTIVQLPRARVLGRYRGVPPRQREPGGGEPPAPDTDPPSGGVPDSPY